MSLLGFRPNSWPERSIDLSVRRLLDSYQRHATAAWVALAVLLGSLQAFAFRYSMNPDGIAYLDVVRHMHARRPDPVQFVLSTLFSHK